MNNISKMNNKEILYNNFINLNDLNDMNSNRTQKFKSNRKNSNNDVNFNNNNINHGDNNNIDKYGQDYKKNKSKDSKAHKRALSKADMKQKAQSKNKFYKLPKDPEYICQEKRVLEFVQNKKDNMQIDEIKDDDAKIKGIEDIIVLNHLKNADKEEEDDVDNEFYIRKMGIREDEKKEKFLMKRKN
jgi:hypothetical protein